MKKVLLAAAVLIATQFAAAQPGQNDVHGRVTDATGAPVAHVSIRLQGCGTVAPVMTDEDGHYRVPIPSSERCDLLVEAPGFALFQKPVVANSEVNPVLTLGDIVDLFSPSEPMRWEYGVLAQYGNGVTDNRNSFHFLMAGAHLGRILTPDVGPGLLKGNFEYAIEVMPLWQAYTPRFQRIRCYPAGPTSTSSCSGPYTVGGTATGASITPILLRWNFTSGQHVQPWMQGGGGVIWTNHKFPAVGNLNPSDLASNGPSGDTSVWNFTPQFGIGAHFFRGADRSIDFAANAVHISSASLGDKNPGVNASIQFSIGYTWWK